jgi:hypothetical protein
MGQILGVSGAENAFDLGFVTVFLMILLLLYLAYLTVRRSPVVSLDLAVSNPERAPPDWAIWAAGHQFTFRSTTHYRPAGGVLVFPLGPRISRNDPGLCPCAQ